MGERPRPAHGNADNAPLTPANSETAKRTLTTSGRLSRAFRARGSCRTGHAEGLTSPHAETGKRATFDRITIERAFVQVSTDNGTLAERFESIGKGRSPIGRLGNAVWSRSNALCAAFSLFPDNLPVCVAIGLHRASQGFAAETARRSFRIVANRGGIRGRSCPILRESRVPESFLLMFRFRDTRRSGHGKRRSAYPLNRSKHESFTMGC